MMVEKNSEILLWVKNSTFESYLSSSRSFSLTGTSSYFRGGSPVNSSVVSTGSDSSMISLCPSGWTIIFWVVVMTVTKTRRRKHLVVPSGSVFV